MLEGGVADPACLTSDFQGRTRRDREIPPYSGRRRRRRSHRRPADRRYDFINLWISSSEGGLTQPGARVQMSAAVAAAKRTLSASGQPCSRP